MKFVRVSLKIRRNSWPTLLTGYVMSFGRMQTPPPPPPPPQIVDPVDVNVLGQVESKSDTSDRGKTPSKKSSHKFPFKKKAGKTPDFQTEVKYMDDKWSQRFAQLEAMFLTRSFQVLVQLFQKSDVVVTDRPFTPPAQQPTGVTGQKQSFGAASQKATQPVEAF